MSTGQGNKDQRYPSRLQVAGINRITTEVPAELSGLPVEVVKNWTRGDIASPDDAAPLAEGAGIDPEFYTELVARFGGAVVRI